jgi:3-deoxy-7-phosphoheptulonate synthase
LKKVKFCRAYQNLWYESPEKEVLLAIQNTRVHSFEALLTPAALVQAQPASATAQKTVVQGREELRAALQGKDKRFVVILGPCSIHDPKAALEYATRLAALRDKVKDKLLVVMRVYFEKPRTTVGWKGLINDPHLNGSYDIEHGLRLGRDILLKISDLGLPTATEFLDPIVPQYTSDLVSWAAIGARTTESQTHRQMASGLSMPVGFKNATDGDLQVALDAMTSARSAHAFVGIDDAGMTAVVRTTGNPDVHIVLRGGGGNANFSRADIAYTKVMLENQPNPRSIMVDCSHGNSNKNFLNQPKVFKEVVKQVSGGERAILGVMLESNLVEGRQDIVTGKSLTYGQSVTDGCIGWDSTEQLLLAAHKAL